jgi:hypothetical protein
MDINDKTYSFLNEKNMHLLNDQYKVCINTFGHKYLLFLTKYEHKNNSIFINKKKGDMIMVRFRFDNDIFNNTLFDGELIKNNKNEWVYVITDIISYTNEYVSKSRTLSERRKLLKDIIENKYSKDETINFCHIDIKKYFNLKYLDDIYQRYISSVPYKCSGVYFQHIENYNKGFMYIFPEFRTSNQQNTTQNITQNAIQNDVHQQSISKNIIQQVIPKKLDTEPDRKYPFDFFVKKTDLPDIYQMFYYRGNNLVNYGYLGVPNIEISKLLLNIFTSDDNIKIKCEYSENFNKWIPKNIVDI